jgi:hypothetical protein
MDVGASTGVLHVSSGSARPAIIRLMLIISLAVGYGYKFAHAQTPDPKWGRPRRRKARLIGQPKPPRSAKTAINSQTAPRSAAAYCAKTTDVRPRSTTSGRCMRGASTSARSPTDRRSPGRMSAQQIPRPCLSGDPESYARYRDEVVDSVSAAAVGILAIFAIAS